jgi:hypothetical protein
LTRFFPVPPLDGLFDLLRGHGDIGLLYGRAGFFGGSDLGLGVGRLGAEEK